MFHMVQGHSFCTGHALYKVYKTNSRFCRVKGKWRDKGPKESIGPLSRQNPPYPATFFKVKVAG